jgi:GPH family glycoside/pentoside/hexuronide:cation symporter
MENETTTAKLPLGTKIAYGTADFGIAMVTAAIQFVLFFYYNAVLGIDPVLVGTALLVGKFTWDAINDPIVGYISDRTKTRWGRRKPYMLLGAIPFGLSVWLLFSLPKGLTGVTAFLVVLGSFLLVDTFQTMVSVPYYAMSAELTYDYNERTSLIAIRMIFTVLGYILGAGATTMIANMLIGTGMLQIKAYSTVGAIFGAVAIITTLITTFFVKEKPNPDLVPSKMPPWKQIVQIFKNRPFVQYMIMSAIISVSFALLTGLFTYFVTYQLGMGDQFFLVMLVMLGTIGLFLIPWQLVSKKMNKGPAYALGLAIACVAIVFTFLLPPHPTNLIYVIAFVAGMGFSAQYVFPWSMIPDVVEVDQAKTGERHEGIYFGVNSLLGKLTTGLGAFIMGWALKIYGFNETAVVQTPHALFGIRFFFAIIPVIAFLLALPLLIWYPITRKTHAELTAKHDVQQ